MSQPCNHSAPTDQQRLGYAQESVRHWKLADRLLSAQASLNHDRAEYFGCAIEGSSEPLAYIALCEAHQEVELLFRQFADEARTSAIDWESTVKALKAKIASEKAIDAVGGLQAIRDELAS